MKQVQRPQWRTALGAAVATPMLLLGTAACAGEPARTVPVGSHSTLTTAPAAEAAGQGEVQRRLRALEAGYENGRIGAYAIDTATGRTVGYRAQETFALNSTFKALACAAVLHKARTSDPGLLDRVIRYTADDLVEYSPETEKEENLRSGMTVSALCEAAITLSDNTAGNLILRQIGGPAGMTAFLRSLGDHRSRLDRWETDLNDWRPGEYRDTTTPALMAQNLRKVTTTDALAEPDRARLIAWMRANTTGDARIRAGLPADWTIGDKTGTGRAYAPAADIAIVWPKGATAPLIMAIYTNRTTPDTEVDDTVIARTATVLAQGLGALP